MTTAVNDARVGGLHDDGVVAPPFGTKPSTAVDDDAVMWKLLPKKLFMNGVTKENCSETLTVRELPDPLPPAAVEQATGAPTEFAQAAVTTGTCSPP